MYAERLDRLFEHDLLLGHAQTVLLVEFLCDFLGGHRAEQASACAALGRNLDRADLELFRRFARRLLLKCNLARMRFVLRLFDVQVVRRSGLRQAARHKEIAAVAFADLNQVALLALALNIGFQNYFHGLTNSFCLQTGIWKTGRSHFSSASSVS